MPRRVFSVLAVVGFAIIACVGCSTPKLNTTDEAFKAVNALFTAVSAKNTKLLDDASDNLDKLKDSGELAPDVHEHLRAIIAKARAGEWQPATKELRAFIKAQTHRTD